MYSEHCERVATRERVKRFRARQGGGAETNEDVTVNETPCTETEYEKNSIPKEDLNKETTTREIPVAEQEEKIYAAYPRKVGRGAAMRAIRSAVNRLANGSLSKPAMSPTIARRWLWKRATEYAVSEAGDKPAGPDYRPHPATWFNAERYFDDDSEWARNGDGNGKTGNNSSPARKRVNDAYAVLDEEAKRKGWGDPGDPFATDGAEVSTPGFVGVDQGDDARLREVGDQIRAAPSEGRVGGSAHSSGPEIFPPARPSSGRV